MRKEKGWIRTITFGVISLILITIIVSALTISSLFIHYKFTLDNIDKPPIPSTTLGNWVEENIDNVSDDEYLYEYYLNKNNIDYDIEYSSMDEYVYVDSENEIINISLSNGYYNFAEIDSIINKCIVFNGFEILKYKLDLNITNSIIDFQNEFSMEIGEMNVNNSLLLINDEKDGNFYSTDKTLEEIFTNEYTISNSLVTLTNSIGYNLYSSEYENRGSLLSTDSFIDYIKTES